MPRGLARGGGDEAIEMEPAEVGAGGDGGWRRGVVDALDDRVEELSEPIRRRNGTHRVSLSVARQCGVSHIAVWRTPGGIVRP